MKLTSIVFSAVLSTAITLTVFANDRPTKTAQNIISEFAESHVNTDVIKLSKILSEDAILKFTKGEKVITQYHESIMFLTKQNNGTIQNCSTQIEYLAISEALVMAKVNFIYKDFIIENFLTLELDKNQLWKITRINKFFTNAEKPISISGR
jgi:hypothetical protein